MITRARINRRHLIASFTLVFLITSLHATHVMAAECRGTVYLTFDTGNMAQAEDIAHTLNVEQVKATFFIANEKTIRGVKALDPSLGDFWRARVAEGHAFGNHTWHHWHYRRDLPDHTVLAVKEDGSAEHLNEKAFCAELTQVNTAFHKLTGHNLNGIWRAPGGHTTEQTTRWAASCGFPVHVGWSDAGVLGDELTSEAYPNTVLLKRALANIRPGDITLLHLGVWSRHEPVAPILKPLIDGLKAKGMCFAPITAAEK